MEKKFCTECGTEYAVGDARCPACGHTDLGNAELFQGGFELSEESTVAADLGIDMADLEGADDTAYSWEDIVAEINGTAKEDEESTVFAQQKPVEDYMPQEPAADCQKVEEPETVMAVPAMDLPTREPEMASESPEASDTVEAKKSREIKEKKQMSAKQRRPQKKKKHGGKKILVAALVVIILAAGAFAAKQFGLLDMLGNQTAVEEEETPELPVTADCTGVALSEMEVTLTAEGEQQQLEATVEPAGCTDSVVWASADPNVVTVDAGGKLTAVAEGNTNVMVTVGDYAATCAVTVAFEQSEDVEEDTEATPEEGTAETETSDGAMALSATDISMFYPGEQARLYVENSGDSTVVWSTDNDVILDIDQEGLITACGTGTANVYAEVDGETFTCVVRCMLGGVEGEVVSVSLNATDITLLSPGDYFQFKVTYENGEPEGVTHTWSSSDEAVCTVDESGIVTAVGEGHTYITTTADGITLRAVVYVNFPDAPDAAE